ncbi:hypothetical protein HY479_00735 [Candidatus Uhrbacteria bacterium]|nr:hypothetical protein [Candidatus Uhrbacteria bacterium]
MKPSMYAKVSGAIFLFIALLHAMRLMYRWPATIGIWDVPSWLSIVALVVSGYLAYVGLSAPSKK